MVRLSASAMTDETVSFGSQSGMFSSRTSAKLYSSESTAPFRPARMSASQAFTPLA